jgi:hypothetical protein
MSETPIRPPLWKRAALQLSELVALEGSAKRQSPDASRRAVLVQRGFLRYSYL